jgi:solute carrier family 29 (equilibrative nucleoside transporter) protein 4
MDELSVTEADDVSRLLDNEESETVEGAQEDADIPKDKFHLVYFSMVIFGAGFLFPFNSFVAAADYFLYIYPGYYAEVVFSFMYMYVTLFSILFTVMTTEVLPLSGRLGFGYVCMFVGLLAIPLLDVGIHNCTLPVGSAFGVTIVCITLISIGAGVQQSSFYGLAGMLSKRHVQAIMVGESVSGIIVSVNRVLTKGTFGDERTSTIVFLVVSMAFVAVCALCLIFLKFSPFVQYHIKQCSRKKVMSDKVVFRARTNGREEEKELVESESCSEDCNEREGRLDLCENDQTNETTPQLSFLCALKKKFKALTDLQNIKKIVHVRWSLMKIIWLYIVAIFLNYLLTLLLFPGITTLVQDCSLHGWTPIILVIVFNVTDFVGKCFALIPIKWKGYQLIIASLLRFAFVPLLMVTVSPSPTHPLVRSVWFALLVVLGIGLTNGYFGSLPMITAPSQTPEQTREVAGVFSVFA